MTNDQKYETLIRPARMAWVPPSRQSVAPWAEENVVLDGDLARKGPFSLEGSRYLEKPFDLLSDEAVRMVNIAKSPQSAGSLVAEVFLQFVFKNRPGPFMMTFQSDDDAEEHYLTRIEPTFLKTKVNTDRFRDLKKKRALYRWPHMSLFIQGANMNSLQSKSIRYEWNDEVWRWRPGLLEEAWTRTKAFRRVCKILNISQGGVTGTDWEACWESGRRYENAVRCEKCNELQILAFFGNLAADDDLPESRRRHAGIVWDTDARLPDGRWDIVRAAETARFKCRHCGHEHPDDARTWAAFDRRSDYICLDPDRPMRNCSVRWNALVSGDWGVLVEKFLKVREVKKESGNTMPMEQFYEKELARFWDPSLSVERLELMTSGYEMEAPFSKDYKAEKLPWETLRVITADYQQGTGNDTRHQIVTARAWGDASANHSRLLWEGRTNSFEDLYKLQLALDVPAKFVCVDGSFEMMEVAAQCAKYGWTMLIGDDAEYFLHKRKDRSPSRLPYSARFRVDPSKGKAAQGRRFCWAIRWSNPSIKNMLWNLRHGLTNHKWEVARNVSPTYREGIDSEAKRRIVQKKNGAPKWVWVQLHKNNHPWDCECMQTVVAIASGCLSFDVEDTEPAEPGSPGSPPSDTPTAPHDQPEQLELNVA